MTTFQQVADAWVASKNPHSGELSRLSFWIDEFGHTPIAHISEADVDNAIRRLRLRGKLVAGRGTLRTPKATGRPLAESTVNRFISTLSSVFKYARKLRVLLRSHEPPTRGIEKAPEPVDPNKYFRPQEVDQLIAVARVMDARWKRLPALITLGFHTGLRVGNLMGLRWRDINLENATVRVAVTKNGHPMVSPLSERCVIELRQIPEGPSDELVFKSYRNSGPFNYRKLWNRVCDEAGFHGRTFHWLRHGCGSALASAGVSQAQIMQVMGHRTLVASARYMHSNVDDKREVVERVFGR